MNTGQLVRPVVRFQFNGLSGLPHRAYWLCELSCGHTVEHHGIEHEPPRQAGCRTCGQAAQASAGDTAA